MTAAFGRIASFCSIAHFSPLAPVLRGEGAGGEGFSDTSKSHKRWVEVS
jgi:hypothetical protein